MAGFAAELSCFVNRYISFVALTGCTFSLAITSGVCQE